MPYGWGPTAAVAAAAAAAAGVWAPVAPVAQSLVEEAATKADAAAVPAAAYLYDELGEKWPVTNSTLTTGGHHLEFGPWPCCTFLARPCFGRTLPMVMTWTICSAHGLLHLPRSAHGPVIFYFFCMRRFRI